MAVTPGLIRQIEMSRSLKLEDQYLSRFGSHFTLKFSDDARGVLPLGLGPVNVTFPVFFAVGVESAVWHLPFQYPSVYDKNTRELHEYDLLRTMTKVILESKEDHQGINVTWEFVSPFYPRDYRLSTVPVFYVTCKFQNTTKEKKKVAVYAGLEFTARTEIEAGLIRQQTPVSTVFNGPENKCGKTFQYEFAITPLDKRNQITDKFNTTSAIWETWKSEQEINPGEEISHTYIFAAYMLTKNIVTYHNEPCQFLYQSLFNDITEVIKYARTQYDEILRKTTLFDTVFSSSSLPEDIQYFIAKNFHVFAGCSWLLKNQARVMYTIYEGNSGYFSTIDVEYNLAFFYVLFWPECLAGELDLWAETYFKGNHYHPYTFGPKYRIMEHDIGAGFEIYEQVYILGPMPVEENANYLLMHYLYYMYTGDITNFRKYYSLCKDLADYILESDRNNNGLPDIGTNNTLDCFGVMFKDMEDQIFLSIKAGASLQVLASLLNVIEEKGNAFKYRTAAELIFSTVEKKGWLDDHYVVTISTQKPDGWDGRWCLSTYGLAYLLFTGTPLLLSRDRIRQDLLGTIDDYTMWASFGIWRDMMAMYFGIDKRKPYNFRPDFVNGMYPRTFNTVGMIQAYWGITVNVPERKITFRPSATGKVPLVFLADWQTEQIPWVELKDNRIEIISGENLLSGYELKFV